MCLVFVAFNASARYPFVSLFNRDEVYHRPTRAAHWWEDDPRILGGRDLERGGSWAGVTKSGRIAMLTFVRTSRSGTGERSRRSRGELVREFLRGAEDPERFFDRIGKLGDEYLPFNLIAGTVRGRLSYYTNLPEAGRAGIEPIPPGVHGLSNANLNTAWPKVERGRGAVRRWLASGLADDEALFALMRDATRFDDSLLPATGVPYLREKALSSLFVEDGDYGTRTTTLLRVSSAGEAELIERTHLTPGDEAGNVTFRWQLE